MKLQKIIMVSALVLFSTSLFAQSMEDLNFINDLGEKKQTTFGDAVKFMVFEMDMNSTSFARDLSILSDKGIATGYTYGKDDILRKGVIARMVARYLKLDDSVFYRLFGTERYAFRACVAAGIMVSDGSERDRVTGDELIEIMRRVSKKKGEE